METLQIVTSQDFGKIDGHRGNIALVFLTDVAVGGEIPDINIEEYLKTRPEAMVYDDKASYSEKFRKTLYALLAEILGRKPTTEEVADFYRTEWEKILAHYRTKFKN
jgi:hypothetical protein